MGKQKSKKKQQQPLKTGLSRRQQAHWLSKMRRLRRLYGITSEPSPSHIAFVATDDGKGIKVVPVYGAVEKKTPAPVRIVRKVRTPKYSVPVVKKPTFATIAAELVRASSREVLASLGGKLLDVSVQPEIVHTVGRMIADRAVVMAKEYVVAGISGGGGRINAGGIIDSIGHTGLDLEISPSGKVSATVSTKTTRKKTSKKSKKASGSEVTSSAEVPSKGGEDTKVEVGHKSVVKRKDGSVSISIQQLNVYITVIHADDMIVSQQTTLTKVEDHKEEIAAAVLQKEPDEVTEEGEEKDDSEPDDAKKKRKRNGKKKDEK